MQSRLTAKRRVLAVLALLALGVAALLATAVSGSAETGTKQAKAKIAIVVPAPSSYWNGPWTAAVKDAAKKFGFSGDFFAPPGSQVYNLTQLNALIDSLAAKGYNGFGVFPGDARGSNAEAAKLDARGIKTIFVNGCTYDPSPAVFCVSTNVGPAAKYEAEQLIKAIGGKGNIALLTSQVTDTNTQLRIAAVKEAVAATQGKVKLVQVVTDPGSLEDNLNAGSALLSAKGKILDGIMSTSNNPAIAMSTILTDNPQYRRIKFIAAENQPVVMNALRKGYIYGTLFQDTYGMGYVTAYSLWKVIEKGCKVKEGAPFQSNPQTKKLVQADVILVTKKNLKQFSAKNEAIPAVQKKMQKFVDTQVFDC